MKKPMIDWNLLSPKKVAQRCQKYAKKLKESKKEEKKDVNV